MKRARAPKRTQGNAMQASTALATQKSGTSISDHAGGEPPEKLTKAGDRLTRAQRAFATTNVSLIAYLQLQAMAAAGGKPVKDDFASDYSFEAVHSLGARDGLEALLAVQMGRAQRAGPRELVGVVKLAAEEGHDVEHGMGPLLEELLEVLAVHLYAGHFGDSGRFRLVRRLFEHGCEPKVIAGSGFLQDDLLLILIEDSHAHFA